MNRKINNELLFFLSNPINEAGDALVTTHNMTLLSLIFHYLQIFILSEIISRCLSSLFS